MLSIRMLQGEIINRASKETKGWQFIEKNISHFFDELHYTGIADMIEPRLPQFVTLAVKQLFARLQVFLHFLNAGTRGCWKEGE